jgi:hypothetical protein
VVALAVSALFHETLLRRLGRALLVDEPLQAADVAVVPEWTDTAGALEAADLVQQGWVKRVVVLLDTPDVAEMELIRRGVRSPTQPPRLLTLLRDLQVSKVEAITGTGNGTDAESRALPAWFDRYRWRTAIVISLPDHSRRLHRLLRRSIRGHSTRVIVRTSRYSSFDPDEWWRTRSGVRIQIEETQKLLLDIALHPFS